jgi:hypothetical protein
MKRLMLIAALAALGVQAARAGWLYEDTLTVQPGATNAVTDITLRGGSIAATWTSPLDFVAVANAAGSGTGNVSWTEVVLGEEYAIASTNGIAPGAKAALWPRRQYTLNAATNDAAYAETYHMRTLRVRVWQASTNSTPTVYNLGAGTR